MDNILANFMSASSAKPSKAALGAPSQDFPKPTSDRKSFSDHIDKVDRTADQNLSRTQDRDARNNVETRDVSSRENEPPTQESQNQDVSQSDDAQSNSENPSSDQDNSSTSENTSASSKEDNTGSQDGTDNDQSDTLALKAQNKSDALAKLLEEGLGNPDQLSSNQRTDITPLLAASLGVQAENTNGTAEQDPFITLSQKSASDVRFIRTFDPLKQAIEAQIQTEEGAASQKNSFENELLNQTNKANTNPLSSNTLESQSLENINLAQNALQAGKKIDLSKLASNKLEILDQGTQTLNQVATSTSTVTGQATSQTTNQQTAPKVPINSLAVHIASQAQNGARRFDIRLDPPELGRIDVRLDVTRDGNVNTHIVVERSETLDLMLRDSRQLERALNESGLETKEGGLTFSLKDEGFSDQHAQSEQDANESASPLKESEDPDEVRNLLLNVYDPANGLTNLDIRI